MTPWLRRVALEAALALWLVVMLITKLHFAPHTASYNWAIVFLPVWVGLAIWTAYLIYLMDIRFNPQHRRGTGAVTRALGLGSSAQVRTPPPILHLWAHFLGIASFLSFFILLSLQLQDTDSFTSAILFLPLIIGLSLLVLLAFLPGMLGSQYDWTGEGSYYLATAYEPLESSAGALSSVKTEQ